MLSVESQSLRCCVNPCVNYRALKESPVTRDQRERRETQGGEGHPDLLENPEMPWVLDDKTQDHRSSACFRVYVWYLYTLYPCLTVVTLWVFGLNYSQLVSNIIGSTLVSSTVQLYMYVMCQSSSYQRGDQEIKELPVLMVTVDTQANKVRKVSMAQWGQRGLEEIREISATLDLRGQRDSEDPLVPPGRLDPMEKRWADCVVH